MEPRATEAMRSAAAEYVRPNDALSWVAVVGDTVLYFAAIAVAVLATPIWIKIGAVVCAGTAISMLFILGHDAQHLSLFSNRRLNAAAGRWTFMPCLHNPTLWRYQHNYLHHQFTNVKNRNSYSPLGYEEYARLSALGKFRERLYRNPVGFGVYYLVERWWKHKFFPRYSSPRISAPRAWLDFCLNIAWLAALAAVVVWLDARYGAGNPWLAILFGVVLPFLVWNQLMGTTAFLQHTHPLAHWSDEDAGGRPEPNQIAYTIFVRFPRWYDYLSHNIMQHPAHHVSPRIPWFRLFDAQTRLNQLTDEMIIERVGLRYLLNLARKCQLYDYGSGEWLDFRGRPTCSPGPISVVIPSI